MKGRRSYNSLRLMRKLREERMRKEIERKLKEKRNA